MKKFLCVLISIVTIIVSSIALCGCSNNYYLDVECKYALVYECGEYILHETEDWSYDNNTVSVKLKCCDTEIITSAENVILYDKEPTNLNILRYKLCYYLLSEEQQ